MESFSFFALPDGVQPPELDSSESYEGYHPPVHLTKRGRLDVSLSSGTGLGSAANLVPISTVRRIETHSSKSASWAKSSLNSVNWDPSTSAGGSFQGVQTEAEIPPETEELYERDLSTTTTLPLNFGSLGVYRPYFLNSS